LKRINHNDLVPWFTQDHRDLPPAYLASCQKFFQEIQAASRKQQAKIIKKQQAASIKRPELMEFLSHNYSQKYLKSLSIKDLRRIYQDWQKHLNVI
jgi:hypothetical protein